MQSVGWFAHKIWAPTLRIPSPGKENPGKAREPVCNMQPQPGISRKTASHAWLRSQSPGAGQEFALGNCCLTPQLLRLPDSLTEARPNRDPGRGQTGSQCQLTRVRPGRAGPRRTCRMRGTGQDPRRQVSAALTPQWKA